MKGVLTTMMISKLKIAAAVLLAVAFVGTGAGMVTYNTLKAASGKAPVVAPPALADDAAQPPEKDKRADAAARHDSQNNLKQIMLALHGYHDVNGRFPPAAVYDKDGNPLLSWRVLILPYVGEDALYKQFKLDEPWDSANNKPLLAKMPKVFAPVAGKPKEPHSTYYQVFTGPGSIFEGKTGMKILDIKDGTSNTFAVVEAGNPVEWSKPADLSYAADEALPKLGGMFKDSFNAATADGAVHTIRSDFDEKMMKAAITHSGGEPIDFDALKKKK
jgi:hypothetical protein